MWDVGLKCYIQLPMEPTFACLGSYRQCLLSPYNSHWVLRSHSSAAFPSHFSTTLSGYSISPSYLYRFSGSICTSSHIRVLWLCLHIHSLVWTLFSYKPAIYLHIFYKLTPPLYIYLSGFSSFTVCIGNPCEKRERETSSMNFGNVKKILIYGKFLN